MALDDFKDDQDQQDGEDGGASALQDALSGGDETFVVAEPKKPVNKTSLLVFAAVVLGLGGYYLMYVRTGPQSAAAAVGSEDAQQADATITEFLSSGEQNLKVMRELRQTTDKVVAQFRSSQVAQVPIDDLQANPFRYAQQKPGDPTADEAAAKKKHDEERATAIKAVQELQLQSVLHGSGGRVATCMINNKMYKEGAEVGGFTIEKITPNSIIVKQGAFKFELKMQH
jgi:hypothetical protein